MVSQFFEEVLQSPLSKYHSCLRTEIIQLLCGNAAKEFQRLFIKWICFLPARLKQSLAYDFAAVREVYNRTNPEQKPIDGWLKPLGTQLLLEALSDDLNKSALCSYIAEDCDESLEEDFFGTMTALFKRQGLLVQLKAEHRIKICQDIHKWLSLVKGREGSDQAEGTFQKNEKCTGESQKKTFSGELNTWAIESKEHKQHKKSSSPEVLSKLKEWTPFLQKTFGGLPECRLLIKQMISSSD